MYRGPRFCTPIISFTLGATTAFFVRDEMNFPTYLRIKQAYLTHMERTMQEPSEIVLRIIDPLAQVRYQSGLGEKIRQSQLNYEDTVKASAV